MSSAEAYGDSYLMATDGTGNQCAVVSRTTFTAQQLNGYLELLGSQQGLHGFTVTADAVMVVWRNAGDYEGHHRLPYGCDPEGWPDGLVFWSKSAAQFMRVTGYADEAVS